MRPRSLADPHASTPAELKARLAAERRGAPFLLFRDAAGDQVIVELDASAAHVTIGRRLRQRRRARRGTPRSRASTRSSSRSGATGRWSTTGSRATARTSTASGIDRPAAAARRRPALLRRDAGAVPRARARGLALDRGGRGGQARDPAHDTAAPACSWRSAGRCSDSAYAAPATQPRDRRGGPPQRRRGQGAPARDVRAPRPRGRAAEPEARAARRARARQRPRAAARLLMRGRLTHHRPRRSPRSRSRSPRRASRTSDADSPERRSRARRSPRPAR